MNKEILLFPHENKTSVIWSSHFTVHVGNIREKSHLPTRAYMVVFKGDTILMEKFELTQMSITNMMFVHMFSPGFSRSKNQ
jgi:hypothetical protein